MTLTYPFSQRTGYLSCHIKIFCDSGCFFVLSTCHSQYQECNNVAVMQFSEMSAAGRALVLMTATALIKFQLRNKGQYRWSRRTCQRATARNIVTFDCRPRIFVLPEVTFAHDHLHYFPSVFAMGIENTVLSSASRISISAIDVVPTRSCIWSTLLLGHERIGPFRLAFVQVKRACQFIAFIAAGADCVQNVFEHVLDSAFD